MAARRAVQAKVLASSSNSAGALALQANRSRIKSTSMTNLLAASADPHGQQQASRPIQRPASRNALDSIHKGMNAKFTHVQSKVLLQNIRPQQQAQPQQQAASGASKIPSSGGSTLTRNQNARGKTQPATLGPAKLQPSERSQLISKIKTLEEELAGQEQLREQLRAELERERADKQEQAGQLKLELEERAREAERHNEQNHQKLLEAYELADQNRRAADSVLSESRQREDQLRKRIDELELQLAELREFVSMKEEMQSKMGELRDQIRAERERYEEKTRSLNQMFETEKISEHMRLDQNSNYFKRAKGALQSSELSIDQLAGPHQSGESGASLAGAETGRQHRSQSDIYGSRLSTRMQDGAKVAWRKSRKFASSLITGGLGGLSSCRRRGERTLAKSRSQCVQQVPQGACGPAERRAVAAGEQAHFQRPQPEVGSGAGGEQHTSVIEVGEQQAPAPGADFQQRELAHAFQHGQTAAAASSSGQREQTKQQISVDENNKLTIVTKFNAEPAECQHQQQQQQPASGSSSSSNSSSSERSRCESSSSGRGTASDCGSSASQNGDLERPKTPSQRDERTNARALGPLETSECQRHKRKSSLFKASEMLSGSQASLNKTFKGLFARKSSALAPGGAELEPVGQLARRSQHSFEQAAPFELAHKAVFQEPPRLDSFKQMGELAREKPLELSGATAEANNNNSNNNEHSSSSSDNNDSNHACQRAANYEPVAALGSDAGHQRALTIVHASAF